MSEQRPTSDRRGWLIGALLVPGILIGLFAISETADGWGLSSLLQRNLAPGAGGAGDYRRHAQYPIVDLPNVVVGLGGGSGVYVDAAFDLEVASEDDRAAVRRQLPRVREETISFLSDLNADELRGSGAISKTKARLLDRFRTMMPAERLNALYVTYFTVAKL